MKDLSEKGRNVKKRWRSHWLREKTLFESQAIQQRKKIEEGM